MLLKKSNQQFFGKAKALRQRHFFRITHNSIKRLYMQVFYIIEKIHEKAELIEKPLEIDKKTDIVLFAFLWYTF